MSGYCDVGKLSIDTRPMMTVRIAMTMATMGRRIKNLDTGLPPRRRTAGGRSRGSGGAQRNHRRAHRSAIAQLLQIVGDHAVAGLETTRDHPVGSVLRPEFHGY